MVNSARIAVDMEFADGEFRTVKPLTISRLRRFMKLAEDLTLEGGKMKDEDIDKMMEAAAVVMEQIDPKLSDPKALEELIDVEIFWKLMQVAMGNKIADPNE